MLGAGITGLCTALAMAREGLGVAVVEHRRIGSGATGLTTAKLSSLQGTRYSRISSRRGEDVAAAYAKANEDGLAEIRRLVEENSIECDLRDRPNYVYADDPGERDSLEQEAEAARAAGLAVEWVDDVPLPFATAGGLRLDGQAEFHPVKFIEGIARAFTAAGGTIFEQTRATAVSGSDPCEVETDRGPISAPFVVLATHYPFTDRALFFTRMHAERSYSLAVEIDGDPPPGMFINAGSPTRSIRSHPFGSKELLLVGGDGHKAGQGTPTARHYDALRAFAERHFSMRSIEYRWSTQDNISVDGAPYIGRLVPRRDDLLVATGYGKWGLAIAPIAGQILARIAVGREQAGDDAFDPRRIPPARSLPEIAREGADFTFRLVGDRVAQGLVTNAETVPKGEGRIVRDGHRQLAVSRSQDGELSILSARCPHMGCIVAWNDAEGSWDCPCHGSRFDARGKLLHGPAVDDLKPAR